MMKKTLVALAATAATGAFAQVAITGNIDLGIASVNSQTLTSNVTGLSNNGISTSSLGFSGSEDLGGGLRAGFKLEATIQANNASTLDTAIPTGASAMGSYWSGTPFNSESFISLSGGFGTVRAGVPNSAMFRAQGASQPFGTALGSGYSGTFSRLGYVQGYSVSDYLGTPSGSGSTLRLTRMQNTIQYESPTMNGLSFMAEYAMQNDNATSTTAFATNSPEFMGLLVNYSAGPLALAASYNTVKAGTNDIAAGLNTAGALATAALAANQNVAYTFLGGNYKLGNNTFYAGTTYVKASDSTEDSTSWNLAYKYALNANVDVIANVINKSSGLALLNADSQTGRAVNTNSRLMAVGADYRLSKRTNLYARYENVDVNTDNASTGETIRTAIGVRHQF
jgi:predicted porin